MKANNFHLKEKLFLSVESVFLANLKSNSLKSSWTRIREEFIDSTIVSNNHKNQSTYISRSGNKFILFFKDLFLFPQIIFKWFLFRNKEPEILVFGSGRFDYSRDVFWDIQLSPYLGSLSNFDFLLIEQTLESKISTNDALDFRLFRYFVLPLAFLIFPINLIKTRFNSEVLNFEAQLSKCFKKRTKICIPLALSESLRFAELFYYSFFFKYFDKTKILFFSSLGTPMVLVEAAKLRGIKTIELQHGLLGYNYIHGYPIDSMCPDYFFSWSTIFSNIIKNTCPKIITVTIGNILLINYIQQNKKLSSGWAFISQGNPSLIRLLVECVNKLNLGNEIVYFLPRPNEIKNFNILFPEIHQLEIQGKVIVKRDFSNSLDYVSKVGNVCGISSTLLFESLCLGKSVYVLDDPDWPSIMTQIPEEFFFIIESKDFFTNHKFFKKLDLMPKNIDELFFNTIKSILND